MKRSTKACAIPKAVKIAVWERDNHQCILCGSPHAEPHAHYISRAQLGKGIEENIVTLCDQCHKAYDGVHRRMLRPRIREYLESKYPEWNESNLHYKKYGGH